jgi:hypothetical protein
VSRDYPVVRGHARRRGIRARLSLTAGSGNVFETGDILDRPARIVRGMAADHPIDGLASNTLKWALLSRSEEHHGFTT